ncbi:hypothetical protein Hanom_Chr14g01290901 [Helianthus anomalus]
MDVVAIDSSISWYQTTPKLKLPLFRLPSRTPPRVLHCTPLRFSHEIALTNFYDSRFTTAVQKDRGLRYVWVKSSSSLDNPSTLGSSFLEILVKKGLILGAVCCVLGCRGVLAAEGVLNGGNFVGLEQVKGSMVNYMPKVLMVLKVTTLWPWKVLVNMFFCCLHLVNKIKQSEISNFFVHFN